MAINENQLGEALSEHMNRLCSSICGKEEDCGFSAAAVQTMTDPCDSAVSMIYDIKCSVDGICPYSYSEATLNKLFQLAGRAAALDLGCGDISHKLT